MKNYYSRIKENQTKGKIWYQAQIKEKCLLSFLFSWKPLSLLILDMELQTGDLKMWSENKKDVQDTLDRFSFIHKVDLEQE